MVRQYRYVGPAEIREASLASAAIGISIRCTEDLVEWIAASSHETERDGTLIATFTISIDHIVSLAPRRSEHVACAGGGPVLSAGEITFTSDGVVAEITNQSTGFCPEPESWLSVAVALDAIPVARPPGFTKTVVFRRCTSCGERSIVKDDWFVCELCGGELPQDWNFPVA